MNILKEKISEIKDKFTKTDLERKLKEATRNEHCHASLQLLEEISAKSNNYNDFQIIMKHISKKLDSNGEKWRRILKTLFLIEHLMRSGSSNCIDSIKSEKSRLIYLTSFSFYDNNRVDKGETIREKSKMILSLLDNKSKIIEEREKFSKYKGRIEAVSSDGRFGSSSSSFNNYSSSAVSYNDYKYKSKDNDESEEKREKHKNKKKKKSKEKKEKSVSSSSSSSDDKKKKKPKKNDKPVTVIDNPDFVFGIEKKFQDKDTKLNKLNINKPSQTKKEDSTNWVQAKTSSNQPEFDINEIFNSSTTNNVNSVNNQMAGSSLKDIQKNNQDNNLISFDNTPVFNNSNLQFGQGNPNNNFIKNLDSLYSNQNTSNQSNVGYNGINNMMMNQQNMNPMGGFYSNQFNYNQQPQIGFNNINNMNMMGQMGNFMNNPPNGVNMNFNNQNLMFNNHPINQPNNFNNTNFPFNNNNNVNTYNNLGNKQIQINKPNDDEFTAFDDGFRKNPQQESGKPLSKLLDPKLVNLDNLKVNNNVDNQKKNNYSNINYLY